jgi:hypothetical protein
VCVFFYSSAQVESGVVGRIQIIYCDNLMSTLQAEQARSNVNHLNRKLLGLRAKNRNYESL